MMPDKAIIVERSPNFSLLNISQGSSTKKPKKFPRGAKFLAYEYTLFEQASLGVSGFEDEYGCGGRLGTSRDQASIRDRF